MYLLKGDYAKAEDELRQALVILRKSFPREHPSPVLAAAVLGLTLTRAGKPAEGEALLREVLEIRTKTLPPGSAGIVITQSCLGECLTAQRRYGEAEPLLTHSYETIKSSLGEQDEQTVWATQRLVALYEKTNRPGLAAQYRAKLTTPVK
jgi:hypothetical protein